MPYLHLYPCTPYLPLLFQGVSASDLHTVCTTRYEIDPAVTERLRFLSLFSAPFLSYNTVSSNKTRTEHELSRPWELN
jgi:hypothetical protein